ncbi:MAG: pyrophosphatase PpaX [Clostridia bacterium]|nr:pyrophosphatase PpaX [Clostridia bacterium]
MFSGVLFDFDGTIVDTTDLVIKSFQYTLKPYLNREVTPEEVYPYFGMPLRQAIEVFVEEKEVDAAMAVYRRYSEEHFDDLTKLCPGILEGLQELDKAGIKFAIVTSRMRKTTFYALKLFNLEKYFPVVVAVEDVKKHKPGPEPVMYALQLLKLYPHEAVMIGDSPHDILAAKAAGVTSVAAGWSKITWEKVLASNPDVVVNSMKEFTDFCLKK